MPTLELTKHEALFLRRILREAADRDSEAIPEPKPVFNSWNKSPDLVHKVESLMQKEIILPESDPTRVYRVSYSETIFLEHSNSQVLNNHELVIGLDNAVLRVQYYKARGMDAKIDEWITVDEYEAIKGAIYSAAKSHCSEVFAARDSIIAELLALFPKFPSDYFAALAYLAGIARGKRIERQRRRK